MAQSADLQPSFEDVFNILSQIPQDKLLSLKYKLKHLIFGPSSKLLQAMILLTLGREGDARICLDALGDNRAAQYVHQTKLGAAGVQEDGEDLQPPQLDVGAMALLAQIYSLLAEEKLCSHEAMDKACQAATKASNASKETQGDTLNSIPPEEQEKHGSAVNVGPGGKFQTLRSDVGVGFLQMPSPNYVVRSSPMQTGGNSDLLGPQTLHSLGSPSLPSRFEISASPTVVFHTQPSSPECLLQPSQLCEGSTSGVGHPDGDREHHGLEETSWASRTNSPPGQDAGAQAPQPEKVLQVSSSHPTLPIPETQLPTLGAANQPVESSDVSSTVAAEPHAPKESTDKKQDEKQLSTGLPDLRATVDTEPACTARKDSDVPAGISFNSASPSTSACSLPPTYSFSSTLPPPLPGPASSLSYPTPLRSSPSPAWPPPLQTVEAGLISEPDGGERKFFTFVVLHASEDEIVAHRVKNLLENMGVPNGATLSEDFFIAGRSHLTCFQDAMENSAFIILLLTKNFPCDLCMFQTNTALMESILKPSKRDSVIPFVPKENPLERSQLPSTLGGLMPLDENSPGFSKTVQNTFTTIRISKRKATWDQMQRRKLQQYQEQYQTLQNLAALNLGSLLQAPPSARQQLLEQSPQQWCPPTSAVPPATYAPPRTGHPVSAQMGPPPFQPPHLPSGHYNVMPGLEGVPHLIIQHARMVQIGNHNTMQVETVTPGPQDSEDETR
ncbi:TIR domain-containing adapter molecule 1 [Rissa tridactyla]|uniref:TIR domain-containing adapter molecule 1 n=1 Tax=Rissa tridactyla TaxID=75485 RepID=UPI0023BA939B|nr:TIR domain-containing adapter molecule 1 [Rissa tridactyla]XP_054037833.1 TIR domain-containing adapter molecule 1 [Rissa tridactyla]